MPRVIPGAHSGKGDSGDVRQLMRTWQQESSPGDAALNFYQTNITIRDNLQINLNEATGSFGNSMCKSFCFGPLRAWKQKHQKDADSCMPPPPRARSNSCTIRIRADVSQRTDKNGGRAPKLA